MKRPDLEETMVRYYREVIKEMLLSRFKDDEKLSSLFYSKPIERQREIEAEIDKQSERIAVSLVTKLKKRGYLEEEPSKEMLKELIVETLKEHGQKK